MKLKRFIAIVLSALMICSCCVSAYASTDVDFELVKGEAKNGMYAVVIAAKNAEKLASAELSITYDPAEVEFENVFEGEVMPGVAPYAASHEFNQAVNTEAGDGLVRVAFTFLDFLAESEADFIKLYFKVLDEDITSVDMSISGRYFMEDDSEDTFKAKSFVLELKEEDAPELEVPDASEKPAAEFDFELVEEKGEEGYRVFTLVALNAENFESADLEIGYDRYNVVISYYQHLIDKEDAKTENAVFNTAANLRVAPGLAKVALTAFPVLTEEYFDVNTDRVEIAKFYYGVTDKTHNVEMTLKGTATVDGENFNINETAVFGPHKHAFETKVIEAATCTEAGIKQVKCSCGLVYTGVIEAMGHNWGKWMVVKEATALSDGIMESRCVNCDVIRTRRTAIIRVELSRFVGLTENGDIISVAGVTVADILGVYKNDYTIVDYKGREVSVYDNAATGMKVIAKDTYGKVLDVKTIIISGDVNGDAKITAADARRALRASVELDKLNSWQAVAADVVYDKAVKAADARIILRASVKLESLMKIFEGLNK